MSRPRSTSFATSQQEMALTPITSDSASSTTLRLGRRYLRVAMNPPYPDVGVEYDHRRSVSVFPLIFGNAIKGINVPERLPTQSIGCRTFLGFGLFQQDDFEPLPSAEGQVADDNGPVIVNDHVCPVRFQHFLTFLLCVRVTPKVYPHVSPDASGKPGTIAMPTMGTKLSKNMLM